MKRQGTEWEKVFTNYKLTQALQTDLQRALTETKTILKINR